ncbi:MAG TPA: DUF2066 domain-containing protein [Sedimenticola thiotaurini]|uniref:DUF2066 domain-containing protein n=1 Tax=Sedimenticola thiotaurini TaxID=1543721 RepID=A0A831W313_9GAMM|nr:DUF2066 domain-containing protein [Sedimenticola thiotaurini]
MDSPLCRPFRHLAVLLFAVLLPLLPGALPAAVVEGLYRTEVPVAGTEAAQRNEAIRTALRQVLVKVSGVRRPGLLQRVEGELASAPGYVLQYSYRVDPDAAGGGDGRVLQVSFDPAAVKRLLQQAGLPVWSENRPSVLVWLGSERNGRRRLLEPDPQSPVLKAIRQAARERGLPLLFPLGDLEDQARLQVADLWGDFEENIRAASERYAADMILTGRLVRLGKGAWRGEWRLYRPQTVSGFQSQGKSPQQVAADGIQQLADRLAALFAPPEAAASGGADTVRIRIAGVTTLQRYAAVERLLLAQRSTERWSLVLVEPDALVIDLHGRNSIESLAQILSVGGVLEPDPDGILRPGGETEMIDLYFRVR